MATVKEKNDGYPTYIQEEALKNGKYISIPTDELSGKILNPANVNAKLFNVNKIFHLIDGNNFSVNIRFRNTDKWGNDGSRRTKTGMLFKNGFIEFFFVMPGFKSTSNVFYAEVHKSGNTENLEKFELDLNKWQNMRCEVKNKHLTLKINDKIIFEGSYRQDLGFMTGLGFKGFLEIEHIEVFDNTGKPVYTEYFNKQFKKTVSNLK